MSKRLVNLFLANDYVTSAGFLFPYMLELLMPFPLLVFAVGSDAAILLKMNAFMLAGAYAVLFLLNSLQFSI